MSRCCNSFLLEAMEAMPLLSADLLNLLLPFMTTQSRRKTLLALALGTGSPALYRLHWEDAA
jgi:hypothetical protein